MDAAGRQAAGSSNPISRTTTTVGARSKNKTQKQIWVEVKRAVTAAPAPAPAQAPAISVHRLHSPSASTTTDSSSSHYCLFPEPGSGRGLQLHDLLSTHHQQPKLKMPMPAMPEQHQPQLQQTKLKMPMPAMPEVDSSNEVLTPGHLEVYRAIHPHFPIQAQRHPASMESVMGDKEYHLATVFPQGIHSGSSQTIDKQDSNANETISLNLQEQMNINAENTTLTSGAGSSGAPENVEQDSEDSGSLSELGRKQLSHIIAVQEAYAHAIFDPDQITAGKLFEQSVQDLRRNGYGRDVLVAHYGDNPADADTTIIRPRIASSCSSQTQHSGGISNNTYSRGSGFHNLTPNIPGQLDQQQHIATPMNNTLRPISIKGQLAAFCSNPSGSRLVEQALEEVATPEELAMAKEIMPNACELAVDVFANRALQKLLEHGPKSYKRELISHLIGHILDLSLHMYGSRVIQKAIEVGEVDQKILMAKELRREVQKCACDQFANHVIQKCIECVPAKHIQFIFRSFCGNATVLSTDPYGCHVIQIYHTLTGEIVEFASELSSDPFGNCVVQHLLEHGSPSKRSMVVKQLSRQMVRLSYHKFASNVIEKCLTLGSQQDRQLITDEIIGGGGGQHYEHLMDMMMNPYANFVIQKMIATAEEAQVAVLVEVARRNLTTLMRYAHGRHVVAAIQSHLGARGGRLVLRTTPFSAPSQEDAGRRQTMNIQEDWRMLYAQMCGTLRHQSLLLTLIDSSRHRFRKIQSRYIQG